jgi:hypothetical protein
MNNMPWTQLQRRRLARGIGYFIGALAGFFKILPGSAHLTPDGLGHSIGAMLMIGGLLGVYSQIRRNVSVEVAGLWLITGSMGIFSVGVATVGGYARLDIALIFLAASFLFLARTLDLISAGFKVDRWRKRHGD